MTFIRRYLHIVVCLVVCYGSPAVLKPTISQGVNRAYKQQKLSNAMHNMEPSADDHKYDHDAFLGHDEALKFERMTPEQSVEALGKIIDKIDLDKDGYVSEDELRSWINYVSKRYIYVSSEKQFTDLTGSNGSENVSWQHYKLRTFGPEPSQQVAAAVARDQRRWQRADQNGDGLLNKTEFVHFAHPEEAPHMRDLVALETLEDMDKNNDGYVDENEYTADMWSPSNNDKEPEWLVAERKTFREVRDKNGDGRLDQHEILNWVLPNEADYVNTEVKHLLSQADTDKDSRLSRSEIIANHDLFAGSQATDFGEALRNHEEL